MITAPDLTHDVIAQVLHTLYALDVSDLTFVTPGGECSWAYQVQTTAQGAFFLKLLQPRVCGDTVTEQGLAAADALAQMLGREQIITAQRGQNGQLLNQIGAYQATLTPLVAGAVEAYVDGFQQAAHQAALGELLAQIHACVPDVRPPHDVLARHQVRDWLLLRTAIEDPAAEWYPIQQRMVDLLLPLRDRVEQMIADYEKLEQRIMQNRRIPLMFCHGDPSFGNVLITPDQRIVLIDWDAPVWGPAEHDLFHLQGYPAVLAAYEQATGALALDPDLLAVYQLVWDIGEIVDYGYRTLLTAQSTAQYEHDVRELTAHVQGLN
jgi:Ser/Thr protein kinase RdoA (MazF antagonist)